MQGWSFPLGRWFGVEVRMHAFLLLLLGLSMTVASLDDGAGGRGIVLWVLLLGTIAVRELARMLAGAWFGMELRGVLLVPTGAIVSYGDGAGSEGSARWMAMAGPVANLVFAGVLAALVRTISPGVHLFARPWITPAYLIRTFFWLNLLMGMVHLLPVRPVGSGKGGRGLLQGVGGMQLSRGAAGLAQGLGIGLVVGGLCLGGNVWMIVVGAVLLLGSQFDRSSEAAPEAKADAIRMRDIMLMQFSTVSASDTLQDALERSVHTLQDVFPVVRGSNVVGVISRQSLVEALAAGGNSYVQGIMTRTFQTAGPDDAVVSTLRRIVGGQGVQLVPVIEGERVVGIITPQNLAQSMSVLNQSRRLRRAERGE